MFLQAGTSVREAATCIELQVLISQALGGHCTAREESYQEFPWRKVVRCEERVRQRDLA